MNLDQDIFIELGKKHGLHTNIIRAICTHPFTFARNVIQDNTDHADIMFAKLFRIRLKSLFKDDKSKPYVKTKVNHIKQIQNGDKDKKTT